MVITTKSIFLELVIHNDTQRKCKQRNLHFDYLQHKKSNNALYFSEILLFLKDSEFTQRKCMKLTNVFICK